jgi:peptidoglycan/LPS O-acetylase OafA/YrhL
METTIAAHTPEKAVVSTSTYYQFFDYVRAIAAVGVFVAHADSWHLLPDNFGNFCVQVFFALSGYLIGGLLQRSDREDLPRFYFNRALRIWIPYAIAIFLLFLVTAIKQGLHDPKFFEFFFYMVTFVYNWFGPPQLAEFIHRMPLDGTANHFWSICVEEQFYLLAPFLIVFLNRSIAVGALVALVVLNFFVPHDFCSIALGALMALCGREYWFSFASLVLAAMTFSFFPYQVWAPFLSVAIIGFLSVRRDQDPIGRVVGGASYSFYLNHWIGLFGINFFTGHGIDHKLAWLLGLAIASTISVSHYLVIDSRIVAYRSNLFTRGRGKMACIVAFCLVGTGLLGGLLINLWQPLN